MRGGGKLQQDDARQIYADIIDTPRHRSRTREPMPLRERAAQFSAYDALAGYYDMIAEEERSTESARELDDNALELLDRQLRRIAERIEAGERPILSFTLFRPDTRKSGGSYEKTVERVRQIDPIKALVVLDRREGRGGNYAAIPIAQIVSIGEDETEER